MEIEVTWNKTIRIWWAWVWRSILLSVAGGLIIGVLLGIISAVIGVKMPLTSVILGFFVGLYAAFYMLKRVLNKDFGDFKIALISKSEEKQEINN